MAREVRGSAKPLLQAIADGDVPRPGLIGYHDWNSWRAKEGQRPSKVRHGDPATTTTTEEAQLWRDIMEALYEADWKDRLARGDGAPDDEEEEDEPQEEEEGEELLSAAGPGPEPAGPSHGGDGSSGRAALAAPSGASSTVGEESVFLDPSVEKLKEVFKRAYEPEKESPQKFAKRLYRLAEALDLEGEAVDEKEMERRAAQALFEKQVHGKPEEEQLVLLKRSFRELVLEDPPEGQEEEYRQRLDVLMAMIQARGGRLSKKGEKLFSSTEGTPEKAPAALRGGRDVSAKDSKEIGARGHGKRKPSDQGLAESGSVALQRWLS